MGSWNLPGPGHDMAAESHLTKLKRMAEIIARLRVEYPDAHCELNFRTPFELVCATILSAQCTDARVNLVTPELFRRWPDPWQMAAAQPRQVEEVIHSTGFFRNKAANLIGMAQALVADHQGQVPDRMEVLQQLPGVGRKTANVVLGNAFGRTEGIAVDTHVLRLAKRLDLSRQTTPEGVERDLMKLVPREQWTLVSHLLIWHGRRVCTARKPQCERCVLRDLVPESRRAELHG